MTAKPQGRRLQPEGVCPQNRHDKQRGNNEWFANVQNLILARDSTDTELAPVLPWTFT